MTCNSFFGQFTSFMQQTSIIRWRFQKDKCLDYFILLNSGKDLHKGLEARKKKIDE